MTCQEIERGFARAGWELDGGFEDALIVGYYAHDDLSLLAHKEVWGTDDPTFEIVDHRRMLTYWIRGIPTPQQAAVLLQEHGEPADKEENDEP